MGPAVLLGLVGAAAGAPLGFITGGVLAQVLVCRGADGSLGAGESCGMSSAILSFLGIPIGALVGAIVGAFVGARRPRTSVPPLRVGPDGVPPSGSAGIAGPSNQREASTASWLAVAGGLAMAFGAFRGWRTVIIPYDQLAHFGAS